MRSYCHYYSPFTSVFVRLIVYIPSLIYSVHTHRHEPLFSLSFFHQGKQTFSSSSSSSSSSYFSIQFNVCVCVVCSRFDALLNLSPLNSYIFLFGRASNLPASCEHLLPYEKKKKRGKILLLFNVYIYVIFL